MSDKRTKVEFIESYWKDGNTDYIWNDNHGELIRCKDCKHLNKEEMRCFEVEGLGYRNVANDDFCSRGVRKDEIENRNMTKQEAICRLEEGAPFSELYDETWERALVMAIDSLKAEPIKHGRWIYEQLPLPLSDGSKECVRCSVCGTHWDNESTYCPNCGVKMDL